MRIFAITMVSLAALIALAGTAADAKQPNKVAGTWRMIAAQIDPDGRNLPAYGAKPNGLLVFTDDMHFVEVLIDTTVPKFASGARGNGTDEENRAAMAGGIGFAGTYSVDAEGEFSGNKVELSTFPNWIGGVRTRKELTLIVDGDRMTENFQRPEGTKVRITFERVR
jgi:hypothetical protein